MMQVTDIVGRLNQTQKEQIAVLLQKDKSYADITLKIYKSYIHSQDIKDVKQEIGLDEKSFKVFERVVYRAILQYFQIEDVSVKDILSTSVFYAVNGISSKEGQEKIQDLEEMFMNMKRYGIEEESAPLLAELCDLSKGTQLETVYQHLYNKYKEVETVNKEGERLIEEFNKLLSTYILNKSDINRKSLIKVYKLIRTLAHGQPQSKTLDCIYNVSRFCLVVVADQSQLLNDSALDKSKLHSLCKSQVNDLAFGMKRFYLNNMLNQLSIYYYASEGRMQDAMELSEKVNKIALLEANNFSFPNELYKENETEILQFKLYGKQKEQIASLNNIKVVSFPNSYSNAIGQPFYDRSRISHLMN